MAADQLHIDVDALPGLIRPFSKPAYMEAVERVRAYTALGLPVLAEGVSTRQQRERLMVLGCSHISGPICGGPYTPTEFASWFGVRKVRPI